MSAPFSSNAALIPGSVDHVLLSPKVKSRMRLLAATSIVQLAAVQVYCDAIVSNFALLAITIQVSWPCLLRQCRSDDL